MAFQYWQQQGGASQKKIRYITLENAYHGDTLGSVSVGGIELFHQIFKPLLFDSLVIKNFSFEQAEQIFAEHRGTIAACIVEPLIQGAAGMRTEPGAAGIGTAFGRDDGGGAMATGGGAPAGAGAGAWLPNCWRMMWLMAAELSAPQLWHTKRMGERTISGMTSKEYFVPQAH